MDSAQAENLDNFVSKIRGRLAAFEAGGPPVVVAIVPRDVLTAAQAVTLVRSLEESPKVAEVVFCENEAEADRVTSTAPDPGRHEVAATNVEHPSGASHEQTATVGASATPEAPATVAEPAAAVPSPLSPPLPPSAPAGEFLATASRLSREADRGQGSDGAAGEGGPWSPTRPELPTFLVRRNFRSGQGLKVDGNLVIMGDVNPGAEIAATGDIIVFGVLRGVAHAGLRGDRSTMVAAFRLRPTQVRIADLIVRAPDEDDGESEPEVPEMAMVRDGRVVIDLYRGPQ